MNTLKRSALLLLLALVPACGAQLVEFSGPADAAAPGADASAPRRDAGSPDVGSPDSGQPDAASPLDGGDSIAPFVDSTHPVSAATNVPIATTITATFSEAMNASTLTTTTFTVKLGATEIPGVVSYLGLTATFVPSSFLATSASYTATVTAGAEDVEGNAMAADYSWSFETAAAPDTTGPRVSSTMPLDLATDVPLATKVTATFSEEMNPLTIGTTTFTLMNGVVPVPGAVTYDALNNIATLTPTAPLAFGITYTALVTTGAKDLAGNPLESGLVPNPWHFTTASAVLVPPTVTVVTPANASTGVAVNTLLTATFSEAMAATSITAPGVFSLTGPFLTPVPGAVTYDALSNTATFTPTDPLLYSTTYHATISTGAKNLAGTPLANPYPWSFSTDLTPDTLAPRVSFTSPADLETNVAIDRKIVATFNEAMDPLTMILANVAVTGPTGPVLGLASYAPATFALTFTPSADLANDATYNVTIKGVTGVKDVAGNFMAANYLWSFKTAKAPDLVHPQIAATKPMDLAIDVSIDTKVTATFTKPMDALTLTPLEFTLMDGLTPVTGTVAYDLLSNTATFSPLAPLALKKTYTALVTNGARDLAGNDLVSGLVPNPWTFKTQLSTGPAINIDMGLAAPFAIAATAGVTNTITAPITHINGNVVLDPDQTCNAVNVDNAGGFGLCDGMAPTINGIVITNTYPNTTDSAAIRAALNAAFLSITPPAGPPAVGSLPGGIAIASPTTMGDTTGAALVLGDNYFTPGTYISITSILVTGDLTLDGQGDSNAQFIFQSASTLTTADGAPSPGAHPRILLINGAKASNVWWQVASSATLGLYSEFRGNILAAMDITLKTGSTSCGRSMAGAWVGGAGAFVFDSNVVSIPGNGCPL